MQRCALGLQCKAVLTGTVRRLTDDDVALTHSHIADNGQLSARDSLDEQAQNRGSLVVNSIFLDTDNASFSLSAFNKGGLRQQSLQRTEPHDGCYDNHLYFHHLFHGCIK